MFEQPYADLLLAFTGLVLMPAHPAGAHRQVPCGNYDNHARVQSMLEDATTV